VQAGAVIHIGELHLHFHSAVDPSFLNPVLEKLELIIMANEEIKASLLASEAKLDEANTTLGKVSGETGALLTEIQTLRDIIAGMQNPDPELVAVVERLATKAQAVKDAAAGVDAQVPDSNLGGPGGDQPPPP
jgi:hypothetical protein